MTLLRSRRGSVLAQVLVLVVVGGLLAAGLVESRLQPSMLAAQNVQRLGDDMIAQGAINRVTAIWARSGSCTSDAAAGVTCSGSGCSCSCDAGDATVTASAGAGAACILTAAAR